MASTGATETRFLAIDGVRIRLRITQPGKPGLPLLLFNGIGASLELLAPFLEHVRNTTTITYDVPGAGGSSNPKYPWRPRRHARLAAKLLDDLGYDKVNVLGISWGGMMAQQFAYQYPRRCERLVLVATSTGNISVPAKPQVLLRLSNPLRYLVPQYMESMAGALYGGSLRTNKLRARRFAQMMKAPSVVGYYYQMFSLVGWTSLPWLHRISQPTLVMAGDDDPIIPLINARVMTARIPNAQLRVVDCGHLFLLTRASILAPEIEQFLG